METERTARLSPKGERTREHILETALRLFVEKGYEATTMRDIAAAAESSLGLTYRYFARKEDLVLALYQRLTQQMAVEAAALPPGTLAQRYDKALRNKLALLMPYRDAIGALFGAAMTPQSGIAVLGDSTSDLRLQGGQIFLTIISGATDAPREKQARQLTTVLYAGYLGLLLFWLNDRSPDYRSTYEIIKLTRRALTLVRPLLALPPVSRLLARLAHAIEPVFGPFESTPDPGETHPG